jgi:hypothetical protein
VVASGAPIFGRLTTKGEAYNDFEPWFATLHKAIFYPAIHIFVVI